MAAGLALSRMMGGAVEGMESTSARRDRDTAREREEERYQQGQEERDYQLGRRDIEDTREDVGYTQGQEDRLERQRREKKKESRGDITFKQGQEERDYQLGRRAIDDTRADKQHSIQMKDQERQMAGNEALRQFMANGDLESVNAFYNRYSPDGVEQYVEKNPDGTYTGVTKYNGKEEKRPITEDDIGTGVQMYMAKDLSQKVSDAKEMKRKAKEKTDDRKFEIDKMREEYRLKRGLERTKGEFKKTGKGKDGKVPDYEKTIMKTSSQIYGGTYNSAMDKWEFNSDLDREKSLIHSDLAIAHYLSSDTDEPISATANREARRDITEFEAAARQYADEELDNGTIDKKQYEARLNELMNEFADNAIKKLREKSAALTRADVPAPTGTGAGGGPAPAPGAGGSAPGRPSWAEYIAKAKEVGKSRNMSDADIEKAARSHYETKYGPIQE